MERRPLGLQPEPKIAFPGIARAPPHGCHKAMQSITMSALVSLSPQPL